MTANTLVIETIREAGINFKSKEIWHGNWRGGTIRDSGTNIENTVFIVFPWLSKEIILISFKVNRKA